jgi:prepilin signal peptidase PulO-like enzyme (type II secretory pathway)
MKSKKTVVRNRFITYLIAFFGIILLVISVFLIASSLNIKTSVDMPILTYNEKSDINYNVYLKENNYFTQKVISKDELKNNDALIQISGKRNRFGGNHQNQFLGFGDYNLTLNTGTVHGFNEESLTENEDRCQG